MIRHIRITMALALLTLIGTGQAQVVDKWESTLRLPIMLLGTANPAKGITEIWHRPGFDIDEDALPVGVEIMALATLELLQ